MENKNLVAILPRQPNRRVLSDLYDSYAPALYGCILKLIPNKKIADIVLVESFVRIYGNFHLCKDSPKKIFPWMLRIVLYQCQVYRHLPNAVILSSLITTSTIDKKE
jgi:DNA-directed RNA polymerase specialized sigma24 family protein